jgi:hypothetical protein
MHFQSAIVATLAANKDRCLFPIEQSVLSQGSPTPDERDYRKLAHRLQPRKPTFRHDLSGLGWTWMGHSVTPFSQSRSLLSRSLLRGA